jgi:hypothetical protein
MAEVESKICLECSTKLTGRVDKKFCSDQCRVSFNNRLNSNETNYVRNVSNTLRKNRRILTELNTAGKTRVSGSKLKEKGFDFQYFTNLYKTKDGSVYYYCYEQGYLPIENDFYLLVVKHDFK